MGNRTTGPGPRDTGYNHDAANRMLQGRQYSYSYDNNGNQTAKSINETKGWIQSWDYENRLITSERTKGAEKRTVTFKYDPFGRRIEKKQVTSNPSTTETTTYVYDNEDIVLELTTDSTGTTKTFYTHGPGIDEPLAMERNGLYYYYHQDGLGSITAISDAARTVVQRYSYSVFGQPRPATSFRNSYQYTGREWDKETGLYFYRARYYDPMEGRFISKDPIGFAGGDVNLFAYVGNNATNYTDPSGLYAAAAGAIVRGIVWVLPRIGVVIPFLSPKEGCEKDDDREKRCEENLTRDLATCAALGKRDGKSAYAICARQAHARYARCLQGSDITPPLPPWGTK